MKRLLLWLLVLSGRVVAYDALQGCTELLYWNPARPPEPQSPDGHELRRGQRLGSRVRRRPEVGRTGGLGTVLSSSLRSARRVRRGAALSSPPPRDRAHPREN